jgi:hypothetical protein
MEDTVTAQEESRGFVLLRKIGSCIGYSVVAALWAAMATSGLNDRLGVITEWIVPIAAGIFAIWFYVNWDDENKETFLKSFREGQALREGTLDKLKRDEAEEEAVSKLRFVEENGETAQIRDSARASADKADLLRRMRDAEEKKREEKEAEDGKGKGLFGKLMK